MILTAAADAFTHPIGLNMIQPLRTNVKNSISNSINAKSTADRLQNESSRKEKKLTNGSKGGRHTEQNLKPYKNPLTTFH